MTAHDRNLLKRADVERFQGWLNDNQLAWRPGKGDFQLMQVKLAKGWGAICVDGKGVVTTPPALREMIQRFSKGLPYTGKTPREKAEEHQAAHAQFLDDLRDDIAMHALQGMLAYPGCELRGSHHNNNTPAGVAEMAYQYADAMLAERAKRINA